MVGITIGLSLAALFAGEPGQPTVNPAETCRRASANHLRWVHSGDWHGQRLILGDVGIGALAVFDLTSSQWTELAYPGDGPLEFVKHEVVPTSVPGALIATVGRLVRLDDSLRPAVGYSLAHDRESRLTTTVAAVETSPGTVLGIAYDAPNGPPAGDSATEPWHGVARITLEPTPRLERVRSLSGAVNELDAYSTRAAKLAAVVGEKVYWLTLDSEAYVLELAPGTSQRLDLIPEPWRKVPGFSRRGGAQNLRGDMEVAAKLSFPAGLLSQGDELLVLHREASPGGATWKLAAVRPQKPGAPRFLTLPTRSPWITVVPGPDYWAILEQGPILGPATQTTSSVLLVPSKWFSASDSPLTRPGAATACPEPLSR